MSELATRQAGRTDQAFAATMDLDRATWCAIRSGRRNIGPRVMAKILAAYPTLADAAISYLPTVPPRRMQWRKP